MGFGYPVKDLQLLFKAPMVRATLGGRKWQTRRIMKVQPVTFTGRKYVVPDDAPKAWLDCDDITELCPYGPIGRKLWVRETWGLYDTEPKDGPENARVFYRATDGDRHDLRYQKWRPSLFMPRWASRITLEVIDIKIERLNDITDADAIAEGIRPLPLQSANDKSAWWEVEPGMCQARSPRASYAALWEMINGKGSWAANPYVWVISYKRADASLRDTSK